MEAVEYLNTESSGLTMENVVGREFWKETLCSMKPEDGEDETFAVDSVQMVLLDGPLGIGKTTLLLALGGFLEEAGWQYLNLDFAKVPESACGEIFSQILEEYLPEKSCYLFLENLESLKDISAFLDFYEEIQEIEKNLVIAARTEDPEKIHPELRKLFSIYSLGLPEREDRKAYLEVTFGDLFENESIQNMKRLLDHTEGFNYPELASLVSQLKLAIRTRIRTGKSTAETMKNLLSGDVLDEVLPKVPKKEEKKQESGISEETLAAIMKTLPAQPQAAPTASPKLEEPEDPVAEFRKKHPKLHF